MALRPEGIRLSRYCLLCYLHVSQSSVITVHYQIRIYNYIFGLYTEEAWRRLYNYKARISACKELSHIALNPDCSVLEEIDDNGRRG